jgi:hypothetical protein
MSKMNQKAPADAPGNSGKAGKTVLTAFDKALKGFASSIKTNMSFALACAVLSLTHFEAHGDTSYIQRFHDAMPKDYARRAAYLLWLREHSPLTMKDGKFVKDTTEAAIEFDLAGAKAKPFWEYAPEREQVAWGANDVVVALERAIKRFKSGKKPAADDAATAKLALADAAVAALKAA